MAVCVDLAITNAGLNLTTDVAKLTPPAWYLRLSSAERLYIGGRVRGFMNTADRDAAQSWKVPAENTAVEGRMELNAELPMAPSGWRVREALWYDLPVLWPSEYEAVVRAFEHAGREQRNAFLRRSGVRWCVLPSPSGTPLAEVAHWEGMKLVECDPSATRVFVTTTGRSAPIPTGNAPRCSTPPQADHELRMPSMPDRRGNRRRPRAGSRTDRRGRRQRRHGRGRAAGEGFVVLRDSFDPSWRATVDGAPAQVVRANGLYRAVSIPAGRHVIRFRYRPRALGVGLTISGMTALALGIVCTVFPRRTTERGRRVVADRRGFTLVELMIVMAIIGIMLAIAFARYQGMQARGNEASAVASMRSIAAAQWSFAQTCGNQKYARVARRRSGSRCRRPARRF